jgi:hypothetical protein
LVQRGVVRIMNAIYTQPEIIAYMMLIQICHIPTATNNPHTPHSAGNYIIALAEAIKAERAVVAMKEHGEAI